MITVFCQYNVHCIVFTLTRVAAASLATIWRGGTQTRAKTTTREEGVGTKSRFGTAKEQTEIA